MGMLGVGLPLSSIFGVEYLNKQSLNQEVLRYSSPFTLLLLQLFQIFLSDKLIVC